MPDDTALVSFSPPVPARIGTFRSAGDAAFSVLGIAMNRHIERMRQRQAATEFLCATTATHAFVITIATGAPQDGYVVQGLSPKLFFAPEALPKLQAHFDLRRLAGSPAVGGMADYICVGLAS